MDVLIKEISQNKYLSDFKTNDQIPLWLSPSFIDCYTNKLILLAIKDSTIKGIWVIPIFFSKGKKIAEREYRFFPYASPIIFTKNNLERRLIMMKFFKYVMNICDSVYLPMDPDFKDLSTIQSLGAFIEWRHTHMLSKPLNYNNLSTRLRNHINNAKKYIKIFIDNNPDNFNFDIAIKGNKDEVKQRKKLAIKLLKYNKARIIYSKNNKEPYICGGIFLVFDRDYVYMFHSWRHQFAPRGTISALIFEAVNWSFKNKKVSRYDFEGSVIYNIDYFFSGFNTNIIPYGYIHWSSDKKELYALIEKSINIDGRLYI